MRSISAVVFEPVGCLSEFPADPFDHLAATIFHSDDDELRSGSVAYWRFVSLLERTGAALTGSDKQLAEDTECQMVDEVELYPDAEPALAELKKMGVDLLIASSLSEAAVTRFVSRFALGGFFSAVWSRDSAGGVGSAPLAKTIQSAACPPEQVMVLADTKEGIEVARSAGANSILMINDYDQGRQLAMHAPTGGIVSLHELPDAIRLLVEVAKAGRS
jgi:phosphoglycolate phosphatase-like HAD superfamily hydrolase